MAETIFPHPNLGRELFLEFIEIEKFVEAFHRTPCGQGSNFRVLLNLSMVRGVVGA